jgi:phosphoglycolate phosphatase-like HAD superfamily hydrolase
MRRRHPDDELLVVFDIDGTIVDLRWMTHDVLRWYDRAHATQHFVGVGPEELGFHEEHLPVFLADRGVSGVELERVLGWYAEKSWTDHAFLASHRPFHGVLEVIRWFQLQERTSVALNTGRSESMRLATLHSLNQLGREFRVTFTDELLVMSPTGDESAIPHGKADAIRQLQAAGYRVIAMVDNEPANLQAVAEVDDAEEILLLHADTVFVSQRSTAPQRTVSGTAYQVAEMMDEQLPRHIQFVWRDVGPSDRWERFLASNVRWGELDVRRDPMTGDLVVRRDDFVTTPALPGEVVLPLADCLAELRVAGKRAKVLLRENGRALIETAALLSGSRFPSADLWFAGRVDVLRADGFRVLADRFPGSLLEAAGDFLAPLVLGVPDTALQIATMLADWGIERVSLSWGTEHMADLLAFFTSAGLGVDLRDPPDPEAFLRAVLLEPASITADLRRPEARTKAAAAR